MTIEKKVIYMYIVSIYVTIKLNAFNLFKQMTTLSKLVLTFLLL